MHDWSGMLPDWQSKAHFGSILKCKLNCIEASIVEGGGMVVGVMNGKEGFCFFREGLFGFENNGAELVVMARRADGIMSARRAD